jgi:hypothetical protein
MTFINHLHFISKPKTKFTYAQIIFFGPLYSLLKKGIYIQLRLHLSGTILLPIYIRGIITRVFKKRLVLFGEKQRIMALVYGILKLRKNDIYTGTGLRRRSYGYIRKPGKIARR